MVRLPLEAKLKGTFTSFVQGLRGFLVL